MKQYEVIKDELIRLASLKNDSFSITFSMWTCCNNHECMYATAHYVDSD